MGIHPILFKDIMKKKTVGQVATELQAKQKEEISAIDQMEENLSEYESEIWACVDNARKIMPEDFFVVVITKQEPLLPNVFRNYFMARHTCPTPDYDQAVYQYKKWDDELIFLWVIPSRDACHHLKDNALAVHPAEKQLLQYVLDFADGTLYKLCKSLNGEEIDSPLLVN